MSESEEFQSLTPINNADKAGHYSRAITYAIKHSKITNIALTGPYGSGKSSIIETYIENNKESIKSISVSLAEFGSQINESSIPPGKVDSFNNEQLPKIEKSILQQVFYQRPSSELPYSRFKRIKHYTDDMLNEIAVIFLGLLLILLFIFNISSIDDVSKALSFYFHDSKEYYLNYIFGFIPLTLCTVYFVIRSFVSVFSKKDISTLKLQSIGEIKLEDKNESILNHYLDEIVYFFERTKVDVVFFEDLDRFENIQVSIFSKLRELNHLLNKNVSITQPVNFVYALKDDMFDNSEMRTKFFDFIIPVIPYVNQSNSAQMLKQGLFEKYPSFESKISPEFIKRISHYVSDMRTIINIKNEFHLYYRNLQEPLKSHKNILTPEKLLGFIVYKNVYPKDFAELNKGKGIVIDALMVKNKVVLDLIKLKRGEVETINAKIDQSFDERLNNIKELRLITLSEIATQFGPTANGITADKTYLFKDLIEHDGFEDLIFQNQYHLCSFRSNGQVYENFTKINISSEPIKLIREKFHSRLAKLEHTTNRRELKKERRSIESEIENIRSMTIQDLLEEYPEEHANVFKTKLNKNGSLEEKTNEYELLKFLISGGYIDENYNFFLTYHHEGGMTLRDLQFVHDVKNEKSNDITYGLNEKENVYEELSGKYIQSKYVLNIDLIDYMLKRTDVKSPSSGFYRLIKSLAINEETALIEFVSEFVEVSSLRNEFIQNICLLWSEFWESIENSKIELSKKDDLLVLILENASIEDILALNATGSLLASIENRKYFLTLADKIKSKSKLFDVLNELEIKFQCLDPVKDSAEKVVLESIYHHNNYALTLEMIYLICSNFCSGTFKKQDLETKQLSTIFKSECSHLKHRIEDEWHAYIDEVYLRLEQQQEPEEFLIQLLKKPQEEITDDYIELLIEKQEIQFEDVSTLPKKFFPFLLLKEKVKPSWSNVLDIFGDEEVIDGYLFTFLNDLDNSKKLSKQKLSPALKNEDLVKKLTFEIVKNNELEDLVYENLLDSVYWPHIKMDVSGLSSQKVRLLINKRKLSFTTENYQAIAENHPNIKNQFIRDNFDKFIENYYELEVNGLSGEELTHILSTSYFSLTEKIALINVESSYLTESLAEHFNELVYTLCDNSDNLQVDSALLKSVLSDDELNQDDKVTILNTQLSYLQKLEILELLELLGGRYRKLVVNKNGKQVFENLQKNNILLNKLHEIDVISVPKLINGKLEVYCKSK